MSFFVLNAPRLVILLGALGGRPLPRCRKLGTVSFFALNRPRWVSWRRRCRVPVAARAPPGGRMHVRLRSKDKGCVALFRDISHAFFALCASLFLSLRR